jgi:hypothetical protein
VAPHFKERPSGKVVERVRTKPTPVLFCSTAREVPDNGLPPSRNCFFKSLFQVGDNVIHVFEPDGEAY